MLRKHSRLTELEIRKQLLVAESEVNRVKLLEELDGLRGEVDHLKKHIFKAGSIVSSAVLVGTALSLFGGRHLRHFKSREKNNNHEKRAWISTALNGARVGASLFFKVRSFLRNRERES